MKTRTWKYGSTLRGKVIEGGILNSPSHVKWQAHLIQDQNGEGHVLINGAFDPEAKEGDEGTLTFTKGGPTGGYWKFQKGKAR